MSVEITLTRGYVALVDDCDANLAEHKWHAVITKSGQVYTTSMGYQGKKISMHRAIMCAPDGMAVDHINRNTLDN